MNVSIYRLIPQEIFPDRKTSAKIALLFDIRNVLCIRDISHLFKRYRFNDREKHFHLHLFCYFQDIGPICCCHFYCGFPPSQSMHSDPESCHASINMALTFFKNICGCSLRRTKSMSFLTRCTENKSRRRGLLQTSGEGKKWSSAVSFSDLVQ